MDRQALFLHYLRQAIGTPYVWGGQSLSGFDCSGLIAWAAQKAGIRNMPRVSQAQFQHGTPVPMNGLRPGDLVFSRWGGETGAGHVSVYIGNGKIIEASHSGTNVHVLPFSVLAGHILGARRVIPNAQGHVANVAGFAQQQVAYHQAAGPTPAQGFAMNANLLNQLRANTAAGQTAQSPLQTLQNLNTQQQLGGLGQPNPLQPAAPAVGGDLNTLHQQLLNAPNPLRPGRLSGALQ